MPVLDRDTLLADAFRYRLDYATALQQAEIEDLRLKYYHNQLLPKIDLVATLGINGLSTTSSGRSVSNAFNGQAPEYIFGIQGSVPLGNVAARANLDSARRLKQEALWKLKQVELRLTTDVDTAIDAIRTNEQRVETARQARKFAEEVVHMQNRRLEEGQASTLDVLDNRRRLYEAQSRELCRRGRSEQIDRPALDRRAGRSCGRSPSCSWMTTARGPGEGPRGALTAPPARS